MFKADDLFDLAASPFKALFDDTEFVWDALKKLKAFIIDFGEPNIKELRNGNSLIHKTVVYYEGKVIRSGFTIDTTGKRPVVSQDGMILDGASIIFAGAHLMDDQIYIGKNSLVEPAAFIRGPVFIGDNTEVRHGAYIRGDVLVGNDCVVGHTTEIKSSVMLGGSKAGHFAYIGDSILGRVNLGAGTKLANLKMTDSSVEIKVDSKTYNTGLRKFGAILADDVETGCNSVTTPGTILAKKVLLYPNGTARGYYPPQTIIKVFQEQEQIMLKPTDE